MIVVESFVYDILHFDTFLKHLNLTLKYLFFSLNSLLTHVPYDSLGIYHKTK